MKKLNILFIPETLRWKILIKWSTVVTLLSVVPCISAHIVESLNLFPSVAIVAFVLPVATNMPWNVLPVCLLNWLMSDIVIAFLPLTKIFGISSSMTVLCLIVFFTQLIALFPACFIKWTNQKTLPLVLLWFYIHSAETSNGIHHRSFL